MIKFRQKAFIAPLAALGGTALMNGLTGLSLFQGYQQMSEGKKQAEAAAEQQQQMIKAQKRDNEKLTAALNNIANKANSQAATAAGMLVGKSKTFSTPKFISKGSRVVRDVINAAGGTGTVGKAFLGLGVSGVAMGTGGYLADKAITKDARNIGLMPKKSEKQYSAPSVMSKVGKYAKKTGKYLISKEGRNEALLGTAFGAFPVAGYIAERQQFKAQQKSSEQPQTKTYASPAVARGISGWFKKKGWDGWKTVTGGLAKLNSMGKYGKREIQTFGKNLKTSESSLLKRAGNWIEKNPNKSNLIGAGVGSVTLLGTMNAGEKAAKTVARKIDKDAFAYEDFKNQEVN